MAADGPVETEIKLAIADPEATVRWLSQAGFKIRTPRHFESNTLYDYPGESLRSCQSVLRLRQAGDRAILTFKGPAEAGKHKTREELETAVGDGEICAAIFRRIGLLPGFRYEKYRTEYQRPNQHGVVTVDETPIGWFLELEGAPEWIDGTASELGFQESDYITLSYGSLYLKHCEKTEITPASMTFN